MTDLRLNGGRKIAVPLAFSSEEWPIWKRFRVYISTLVLAVRKWRWNGTQCLGVQHGHSVLGGYKFCSYPCRSGSHWRESNVWLLVLLDSDQSAIPIFYHWCYNVVVHKSDNQGFEYWPAIKPLDLGSTFPVTWSGCSTSKKSFASPPTRFTRPLHQSTEVLQLKHRESRNCNVLSWNSIRRICRHRKPRACSYFSLPRKRVQEAEGPSPCCVMECLETLRSFLEGTQTLFTGFSYRPESGNATWTVLMISTTIVNDEFRNIIGRNVALSAEKCEACS